MIGGHMMPEMELRDLDMHKVQGPRNSDRYIN